MSVPDGVTAVNPPPPIRDAAYNAMAVASLHYAQAVSALRHIVQCAHGKGLTLAECCDATGLDEPFVARLLAEIA